MGERWVEPSDIIVTVAPRDLIRRYVKTEEKVVLVLLLIVYILSRVLRNKNYTITYVMVIIRL